MWQRPGSKLQRLGNKQRALQRCPYTPRLWSGQLWISCAYADCGLLLRVTHSPTRPHKALAFSSARPEGWLRLECTDCQLVTIKQAGDRQGWWPSPKTPNSLLKALSSQTNIITIHLRISNCLCYKYLMLSSATHQAHINIIQYQQ